MTETKVLIKGKISDESQAEMIRRERIANNAWHKFCRNKAAVFGLLIVMVMVFLGLLAPFIATHDPNAIDVIHPYLSPMTDGHFFGTDDVGRDLFSRIIYGARMSVLVALGSTFLGGVIGIVLGLFSGYMGGVVDTVIMRCMDGMFAFPFILMSILLVTILGPGVFNVILAIGIGNVPRFARVVRGQVIIAKNEEYCNAEKVLGASKLRLMFSHILPNTLSEVIIYATLNIGSAIISEASLSFLGLGILIPTASWGNILRSGKNCLVKAPWIATFSGLFIFITVIGFNLMGDGIRDVMDPKMKR
ncbi:MAG: ABC transporter permease [Oliverpabstia sp.]